jgi:chorismate mutase/prephenate dehydratase
VFLENDMTDEHGTTPTERLRDLEERRRGIDRIDSTIVALLAERVRLGREIGVIKQELDSPVYVPEREAQVLDRVRHAAGGRLPQESTERIFSVIIAETTRAQQREGDDA